MYWDFPLCTMILCLLPGYQKKWSLHNHTVPVGFICFLLPSPSTYSLIASQTQLGDQHPKDTEASVTEWEWRPPRPPWERLQWEFKLYLVCKGATVWHRPVTRKGDRNVLLKAGRKWMKARTKATANPGSSSRLPTKVLWCYSETGFVCFCPT